MIDMVRRKRRAGKSVDASPTPSKQVDSSIGKGAIDDGLVDALNQPKTVENAALNTGTIPKDVVNAPTNTPTPSPVDVGPAWDSTQAAKEAARMNESIKNQPEFKQVQASDVVDQLSRGYKDGLIDESIKDALNPNLFIPRDKHLLVPINVQAYVVPRNDDQIIAFPGQSKDKPSKKAPAHSQEETTTFHAPLGLDFRPLEEGEEELVWRIPNAFTREINGKNGGGLPPGIHLYWTRRGPAGRSCQGSRIQWTDLSIWKLQIPETFISTDPNFEHLFHSGAIKHRVEFTTEEDDGDSELNDALEFLPSRLLARHPSVAFHAKTWGTLRSWVIDHEQRRDPLYPSNLQVVQQHPCCGAWPKWRRS